MYRKVKAIDVNKLVDADDMDWTTKKGEMRKLYPAIHQKLSSGGWSAKDMVEWLGKHGMDISVELFRVYLRDIDREHGYERSADKLHGKPPVEAMPVTAEKPLSAASKGQEKHRPIDTASADELVRPAGMSDAAWSEMKAKARAAKRKQKFN